MIRSLLALLCLSTAAFAIDRGDEIRLWPNGAPGSMANAAVDRQSNASKLLIMM